MSATVTTGADSAVGGSITDEPVFEARGIDYIPHSERKGTPMDLALMWAGALLNIEYVLYGAPGVPAAEYPAFLKKLSSELRQIPSLRTGEPLVSEVFTRDEVFQGPHHDAAPDLTLILSDGGLMSILPSEEIVSKRPGVCGSHRPVGIFGARGPAIRRGFVANELSILDIAPTVLYSLGLPLPEELQGRLPVEVYHEAVLKEHPVRQAAAGSGPGNPAGNAPVPGELEDEETVLERLRELGYIE